MMLGYTVYLTRTLTQAPALPLTLTRGMGISSVPPAILKSALRLHAGVRGRGRGRGRGRDIAQVGTSTERGGPPYPDPDAAPDSGPDPYPYPYPYPTPYPAPYP